MMEFVVVKLHAMKGGPHYPMIFFLKFFFGSVQCHACVCEQCDFKTQLFVGSHFCTLNVVCGLQLLYPWHMMCGSQSRIFVLHKICSLTHYPTPHTTRSIWQSMSLLFAIPLLYSYEELCGHWEPGMDYSHIGHLGCYVIFLPRPNSSVKGEDSHNIIRIHNILMWDWQHATKYSGILCKLFIVPHNNGMGSNHNKLNRSKELTLSGN